MPTKRLTEEGVARLKPPAKGKQVDYHDAGMPGLVLRVNYGGAKVWRALHYVQTVAKTGKRAGQRISMPTTRKLGRYPHLKLKEAREKARHFLADPQKALTQANDGSFRQVAEDFIRRYVVPEGLRSRAEIERVLQKYVYPRWEAHTLRELRRSDVTALMDQVQDQHGARQADVCLAIIRKIMHWVATRDDHYVVPVVKGMSRSKARSRDRILSDDEIRAMWKTSDGTLGAMLKVLLLTAQRRDKVATMKWDDLDLEGGVWTIATAPREKSSAGSLQLPRTVLDIIAAQPRIAGNPFVFPGMGDGSFTSFAYQLAKRGMTGWTIHDLRRTARSLMSRAGVTPHVSERVLGHTIKGVEQVYDRHGYDNEKAQALLKLAAQVEQIINPPPKAKVAQLNEHRQKKRRS